MRSGSLVALDMEKMRGWEVEGWEQHGAAQCSSAGPQDAARHISLMKHLLGQTAACTFLQDVNVQ